MSDRPIEPPATIGILGGGQLGRMLGFAARAMGYRVVVLDPDPSCPAAAIADRVIVATYDDVEAARGLVGSTDVVTYELEDVALEVVDALEAFVPVRPGPHPLRVSGDRISERRFVESSGARVAPWREVRTRADLGAAAEALGTPLRLKSARGGYDGRSQVRIGSLVELEGALERLGRPAGTTVLAERELEFTAELSVIVARSTSGHTATFPPVRNVHDAGILVESVAPAPVDGTVVEAATGIGLRLAIAMDLVGTLTVELFLLPDGSLVVNELAPRVHNSGHWTMEGAATSQFEQHIRAICGLPLGSTELHSSAAATVNLLGSGPDRPARLRGVGTALADSAVHLHVYDKRRVFERRKMGHLTALGSSVDEALERARMARAALVWDDGSAGGDEVDQVPQATSATEPTT